MALFHTTVLDNQIKALDTIGSASGSIATFDTDRAERLVKCVCEVASGSSEINVTACGVNLFNKATIVNNKWFSDNGSIISLNGRFYSALIPVEPNTDYYLTNVVGAGSFVSTVHFESDRTTIIGAKNILGSGTRSGYITTFANSAFMLINGFLSDIDTVQVVKGNTATAYSAYNGTTYNIQFGETLSDTATYDAISGVLTRNDSTTKQLDSCNIVALDNETNNVYSDTGDIIDLKFILSVGKAIS